MEKQPLVCVDDYEQYAKEKLGIYASIIMEGADENITLTNNRLAFSWFLILPKVLRNVSNCDLSTSILGNVIPFPICASPSANHTLAHQDGEIASSKGVTSCGSIFTLTHWSENSVEKIITAVNGGTIFAQLGFLKDHKYLTYDYMQRAERCGCKAFVVTCDQHVRSKKRGRRRIVANNLEPNVRYDNFPADLNVAERWGKDFTFDSTLDWETIRNLKKLTSLPIIVKGIVTEEGALEAVEAGASGIMVSNHGGRQLDCVPATLEVLPRIIKVVKGRCEVYLDGGIRTGSDVFKALALGAKAVFVGRPVIYGLAYDGENGVRQVMEILRDELKTCMTLAGCRTLAEINSDCIVSKNEYLSHL